MFMNSHFAPVMFKLRKFRGFLKRISSWMLNFYFYFKVCPPETRALGDIKLCQNMLWIFKELASFTNCGRALGTAAMQIELPHARCGFRMFMFMESESVCQAVRDLRIRDS